MQLGQDRFLAPDAVVSYGANDTPMFGKEGFTLGDVVDIINPLQHIPFVSTLYATITGDTQKSGSRLIGGALYGGPVGVFASAINLAFEQQTGHDVIGAVVAGLMEESVAPATLADGAPVVPEIQVFASTVNAGPSLAPDIDAITQTPLAEILPPPKSTNPVITSSDHVQDVLSLFDAAAAEAQRSYRKAQALNEPTVTTTRDLVM
jgi:hypothetical protein